MTTENALNFAKFEKWELFQEELKKGFDINSRDKKNKSLLFYCGYDLKFKSALKLISFGANPEDFIDGFIAKNLLSYKKIDMLEELALTSIFNNIKDISKPLPVSKSSSIMGLSLIDWPDNNYYKKLLENKLNSEIEVSEFEKIKLVSELLVKNLDILNYLDSKLNIINEKTVSLGLDYLMNYWCSNSKKTHNAQWIIKKSGVAIENCILGKEENTLLHYAIKEDNIELLNFIIPFFDNLDVKNKNGQQPLYLAVIAGRVESAKILIDAGADPELRSGIKNNGKSPLFLALRSNNGKNRSSLAPLFESISINSLIKGNNCSKKRKKAL